jgi:3-deoxy-D-manno-octulosonate 8-phosphate phosphatase (KDO 8-P phosphatase)
MPETVKELGRVKLLLLDVDGVLTDGHIVYNDDGSEIKVFNAKDGLGLRLLMDAGIQVGIVTGRSSGALVHRCKNLGIPLIFDGVQDKSKILVRVMAQENVSAEEIAFMGDDLPDLSIMKQVGLPIAVKDAHEIVVQNSKIVTSAKGGAGAVREICEAILKAKGLWEKTISRYS